jgi:hypothetical protein
MMAKQVGISVSAVQRIWCAHGLQPHGVRQFKLSPDRQFVEKLRDVVGLYVDPPAHAVVQAASGSGRYRRCKVVRERLPRWFRDPDPT